MAIRAVARARGQRVVGPAWASAAGTEAVVARLGPTIAAALEDLEAGRDRRAVRRLVTGLTLFQAWARARAVRER